MLLVELFVIYRRSIICLLYVIISACALLTSLSFNLVNVSRNSLLLYSLNYYYNIYFIQSNKIGNRSNNH